MKILYVTTHKETNPLSWGHIVVSWNKYEENITEHSIDAGIK